MATLDINSIGKYQGLKAKSLSAMGIEHKENMWEKLSSSFIDASLVNINGIGSTQNTIGSIAKTLSESISDINNSHLNAYKEMQKQAEKAQSAMLSSLGKTSFDDLITDIPCGNFFDSRVIQPSIMGIEYKEGVWKKIPQFFVDTSANLNGIGSAQNTIGSIDKHYEGIFDSSAKSFSALGINEDMLKIISPSYKEASIAGGDGFSLIQEKMNSMFNRYEDNMLSNIDSLSDTMKSFAQSQNSLLNLSAKSLSTVHFNENLLQTISPHYKENTIAGLASFKSTQRQLNSMLGKYQEDVFNIKAKLPSYLDDYKKNISIATSRHIAKGLFDDFSSFSEYTTSKSYMQFLSKYKEDLSTYKHIKSIEESLVNIESISFQKGSNKNKVNLYQKLNFHYNKLTKEQPILVLFLSIIITKVLEKGLAEFIFLLTMLISQNSNQYVKYQKELTTSTTASTINQFFKVKKPKYRIVSSTILHIRRKKSMNDYEIIGRLFKGSKVEIHYKEKNWCYIKYKGSNKLDSIEGWTNTKYLKVIKN